MDNLEMILNQLEEALQELRELDIDETQLAYDYVMQAKISTLEEIEKREALWN